MAETTQPHLLKYDLDLRERYLQDAKSSFFLDSVFLINYYNKEAKRWGVPPKPSDITPNEVFGAFNETEYASALQKYKKLMSDAARVAMAFYRYSGVTETYETSLETMKLNNPEFNEHCYSLAVKCHLTALR